MKNIFLIALSSILISSCSVKPGGGAPPGGNTLPGGGGNNPAVVLVSQVLSQPSLQGIIGHSLPDQIVFGFKDKSGVNAQVPATQGYSVKAYKDSACTVLATGILGFQSNTAGGVLTLTNIRYSKAEDVYVGISGTSVERSCTRLINFVSAQPAYFAVVGGFAQTGYVNSVLPHPIEILVMDAQDRPVVNARVLVDGQISLPSEQNGVAKTNLRLGKIAGDGAVDAVLSFNGFELHREPIAVTAMSEAASLLEIYYQDEPTEVVAGEPSNPIYLRAFDKYENVIHPSSWIYSWEVFKDVNCSVKGPEIIDNYIMVNPSIDYDDKETWLNLFIYAFEDVGIVYFKFYLINDNSNTVGSVCSKAINIVAP